MYIAQPRPVTGLGAVDQPAGHVADGRVLEVSAEHRQRVRRVHGVRIREHEEVARRMPDRQVQGGGLATPRILPEHDHPIPAGRAGEPVGAVRGGIGHDDDLDLARRIVELQLVGDVLADAGRFVACGDDDRDRRLVVALRHTTPEQPSHDDRQQRVTGIGVTDRRQTHPEDVAHCFPFFRATMPAARMPGGRPEIV